MTVEVNMAPLNSCIWPSVRGTLVRWHRSLF